MPQTSVRVFLGSTRGDLDDDCRPSARRAIRHGGGDVIDMDGWAVPYVDAVVICKRKLEQDSTHYVGLFAYRRGWTPEKLDMSITEAEFRWALACRKKESLAVFLPDLHSECARDLRERAAGQSDADRQAQEQFHRFVQSNGTVTTFADFEALGDKVAEIVRVWCGGGLYATAPESPDVSQPLDVETIGRRQHEDQFRWTLDVLPPQARLAGFVLHGPAYHGHAELAHRLTARLGSNARCLTAAARAGHRPGTVVGLTSVIGKQLGAADHVAALRAALETSDVILDVSAVEKLDGSLPALVGSFWRPLAEALRGRIRHRLVLLARFEDKLDPSWTPFLQEPCGPDSSPADFDPARFVQLAPLAPFTKNEIAHWLYRHLEQQEAEVYASELKKTTKGQPFLVFNRLREELAVPTGE